MSWEESTLHQVTYGNFSGGFLMDSRLPYTVDDYVHLDTSADLLVLISGCIHNREEIFKEITLIDGAISNPSLVAFLFLYHGVKFVQRLNGDFVIAIYQANTNTLLLFRDHLGIGPVAYTLNEQLLYFSSDIVGLCRTFYKPGEINVDYLLSNFKPVNCLETPNKQVQKLKPGHYLTYDSGRLDIIKYWKPERIKTNNSLTQERVLSELKSLVADAVHIRSDKRFRAGAHVSGGLDSGLVAALVRKEYSSQEKFYGFSWSSHDISAANLQFDEREYVQKTCDLASIIPVYVHLTLDDFINLAKSYLKNQGYLQEQKILDTARHQGINLIFSGWGGDEFISKGNQGIDSDLFFNLQWKYLFQRYPLSEPKNLLGALVFKIFLPALHILRPSVKAANIKLGRYLRESFKKINPESSKSFYSYRSRRSLQLGMLYNYHLPERAEAWFINGYMNGVEYRYPLLDKRIVEYMLKVPSKYLIKGKLARIILREISNGILPEEVRWRESKYDPVFFDLMNENKVKAGIFFKAELNAFKNNPYLQCFDFSLLETDLNLYELNKDTETLRSIYIDIFSIKLFHEFVENYVLRLTT